MNVSPLIWIAVAWVLLNAIFPLFLNSLERLYKHKIDSAVKGLVHLTGFLTIGLVQLFFMALFAPTFLAVKILELVYPHFFEFVRVKKTEIKPGMDIIFSKQFWPTMVEGLREWKKDKKMKK
jgi:hypothetical protein